MAISWGLSPLKLCCELPTGGDKPPLANGKRTHVAGGRQGQVAAVARELAPLVLKGWTQAFVVLTLGCCTKAPTNWAV